MRKLVSMLQRGTDTWREQEVEILEDPLDFAEVAGASAGRDGDREEPPGEKRGQERAHGAGTARACAAPAGIEPIASSLRPHTRVA
jgi:hypothetical protein